MIAEFLEVTFSRHGTCKLLYDTSLALARSSPTRRYTGINTEVFAFISVYGPNSDQPNFFSNIFARLQYVEIDHTIIGGI